LGAPRPGYCGAELAASPLTVAQRLEWLAARIAELECWLVRDWRALGDWTFDGRPLRLGEAWPERDGVRRLEHPRVELPAGWPADDRRLVLDLGGEGLLSLTYAGGAVDRFGLDAEHHEFRLRDEPFAPAVEIVARLPFGAPNRDARLAQARAVLVEPGLAALTRRLRLVLETAAECAAIAGPLVDAAATALRELRWPSATWPYIARQAGTEQMRNVWRLPDGLDERPPALGDDARASVDAALATLAAGLGYLHARHPPAGALLLTGHAHLDLAWRWPLAETRRKARRTLWTAVGLLERHPELHFNQSSAQVYSFLEEDDPELLGRIESLAAGGRFEPIGGMWVEPDCNMPAGESLARQLLYGQRYFHGRFGAYHSVCWLPDCFGFTPALPQLLASAGIHHFFTVKLSWSETNRFPHDLFWWEGLDGSRVLAHMFTNPDGGYNGVVGPRAAVQTWRAFEGADALGESLLSVGYGDGGGGPTEAMVQRARDMAALPAVPAQRFGRVDEFFARAEQAADRAELPLWSGELYLELHRGTLTTQGRVKRLHRRAERDLVAAEVAAALCELAGGRRAESLEPLWRVLLRNQFHDILPGSSIREVYETAEEELAGVVRAAGEVIDARLGELAADEPEAPPALLVVNPDISRRPLRVALADGSALTGPRTLAGLEAAVIHPGEPAGTVTADATALENGFLRVELDADGTVARVLDKRSGREALAGRGNQLWAYVDKPRQWDAWDLEPSYAGEGVELLATEPPQVVESGPHRAAVRVVRAFRDSRVVQDIRLWAGSPRIDFHTRIEWHDRRWLLKVRWPLAVRSPWATFETAFGVIQRPTHRNTSWEAARFEVAGHRFADLSEPGFGVALLNDGRYGHHAVGSELGLSLLRSPVWPDPLADEGEHELTYALLPHDGGWLEGGVLAEAEDLNRPLLARPLRAAAESSLRPLKIGGLPAGLGALKAREDGDGLLLRLYEPQGARGRVSVGLPPEWELAGTVDLLEREAGSPDLDLTPFAVRSLALRRSG
jgi:alpha-mannosidase